MPGLCDLISATAWAGVMQGQRLLQSHQERGHPHEESYCTEDAKQQQNSGKGGVKALWHLQVRTTASLAQAETRHDVCLPELVEK